MNKPLVATINLLCAIRANAQIQSGRNFLDLFADRIRQAATEPTLLAFGERLAALVDAAPSGIPGPTVVAFASACGSADAAGILAWMRDYPRIAAMLAALRDESERTAALDGIEIAAPGAEPGVAVVRTPFDIGIEMLCATPLAHGADTKAGNATLFRRMQVLSTTGQVMSLPFFAGNALRGILRDALADHLLGALGLPADKTKPALSLWFFHTLYAGGALEENSDAGKALAGRFGKTPGTLRTDALREFRDLLPAISLLGCALGNRVLCGRVQVGDLRPRCREWGTGTVPAGSLMEWTFLTRREDLESHDEHTGMIATTETLRAGTVLDGGIDTDLHISAIERAALARGLLQIQARGRIGAENRRDLGGVQITFAGLPDPAPYDTFLAQRKADILVYLKDIGALAG